jgi:hypothetical protein
MSREVFMKKNSLYGALAIFAVAVCVGYFGGTRSWKGVVYLSDGSVLNNTRNPAAIRRDLDFSHLNGAELITATQKRLVTAARTILKDDLLGVELGHFVTRDESGQRRLACDAFYNRLTLRFEAEGMASAGEKPEMEIDGPCLTSTKDITAIEPIWIPVKKILGTRAVNSDLDFFEGVKFKFVNMNGDWPMMWSLQSVRLYNSQESGREVNISTRDLHELRAKPLILNWLEARKAAPPTSL